ncbi:MAG: sulfite exporter TauE/SafE family protein, partial [Anaerolineae bacterium]|nr:sulfite exporter TauE/SafE family protein [Anaerolineae bacterium]
ITSTLAHTGGPPIAIYLLMQNISPRVFVATSALFFAILNWLKVPSYYYLGLFDFNLLWQVAWLLPLLPLSVWIGKLLATKVNKVLFDRIIIGLLALTALFLLFE